MEGQRCEDCSCIFWVMIVISMHTIDHPAGEGLPVVVAGCQEAGTISRPFDPCVERTQVGMVCEHHESRPA